MLVALLSWHLPRHRRWLRQFSFSLCSFYITLQPLISVSFLKGLNYLLKRLEQKRGSEADIDAEGDAEAVALVSV